MNMAIGNIVIKHHHHPQHPHHPHQHSHQEQHEDQYDDRQHHQHQHQHHHRYHHQHQQHHHHQHHHHDAEQRHQAHTHAPAHHQRPNVQLNNAIECVQHEQQPNHNSQRCKQQKEQQQHQQHHHHNHHNQHNHHQQHHHTRSGSASGDIQTVTCALGADEDAHGRSRHHLQRRRRRHRQQQHHEQQQHQQHHHQRYHINDIGSQSIDSNDSDINSDINSDSSKWQHVQHKSSRSRCRSRCLTTSYSRSVWLMFWLCAASVLDAALPEVIYRVDPLALLAATLRTYQRAGCDSEQLSLSCPRGTSISIELAQYGRAGDLSDHSLCPPISQEDLTTTGSTSDSVIHSGTEIEVKPPEACTVSGLQYALLQTVVDACQKKRHCKFSANSKTTTATANRDPCSGIRKFVEIAYKCRPYEFRSKVACENDNMPLVCNPYSRIAIYSASFGHIERESVQCGQGQQSPNNIVSAEDNVKQTCLASYATETVMQICHGRRRCSITADAGTFGRPCKNDVRMYLKVVYTCIPRKVLKDRYETAPEADEPQQSELDMDQDELYDEDQFYKESEAIPPAPKIQGAIPNPSFPFDSSAGTYGGIVTSTLIPPLLSRNENSLEDTNNNKDHQTDEKLVNSIGIENSTIEHENVTNSNSSDESFDEDFGNFIYKKKCEMTDEWGPMSLNCTSEDITKERIEVIVFLSNWLGAYIHIRKNQEQFYLYLIISVAAGVLLCLTLVIGRLTLQKRRGTRKNSTATSNNEKSYSDGSGAAAIGSKYQSPAAGETQLSANSFGDDISDIDADIDLTSPMPVPSLSSRNETYITYAPAPNCSYGNIPPHSTAGSFGTATTVLMPHHGGLPLSSGQASQLCAGKMLGGGGIGSIPMVSGSRQATPPPPAALYTSMGVGSPTVSGPLTMGPHMLAPSALNAATHSSGTPSYLSGSIMVPGHHHAHVGTLRRTLVPGTSIGVLSATAAPATVNTVPTHSITGIPSASNVYYDTTIPRNLTRGMSADNTQYFYG